MNNKSHILSLIILSLISIYMLNCENEITKIRNQDNIPIIESTPEVTEITHNSAIVSWVTDTPCTSLLKYWIIGDDDTLDSESNEYRQNQSVTLQDLVSNSNYSYKFSCVNIDKNEVKSEDYTFSTTINYSANLDIGWIKFESSEFDSAIIYFRNYLQYDVSSFDALLGLGWSFCRYNQMDSSQYYFDEAGLIKESDNDILSGLTMNFYIQNSYSSAISNGKKIYDQVNYYKNNVDTLYNPLDSLFYVFQHDPTYDNLDISLILADCYINTLAFSSAQTQIDFLLPNNTLDPNLWPTWLVNSTFYEKYEYALQAKVDSLKTEFWENGIHP